MSSSDAQHQPHPLAVRSRSLALLWSLLLAVLLAGALALGVWHGARFVDHSLTALAVPFPLDGLEGTLLHEAWLLRSGEPLYQPLQPDRFVSAPYPPLHYVALALFAPAEWRGPHVFFDGRLVSLVATLLTLLCLGLTVLRLSRSLPAAALAVALWLAFPPVQLWATRIKPDPLALLFTAAGLLAVTFDAKCKMQNAKCKMQGEGQGARGEGRAPNPKSKIQNPQSTIPYLLALLCFVAAAFTKQTAVVAPFAVGLALLLSGGREAAGEARSLRAFLTHRALWPALAFGALYWLLVGGIWLGLDVMTNGQYTFHIWGLHRSEWWSFALMRKFLELLQPSWPLALLALAGLLLAVRALVRDAPSAPALLPACYLLVAPLTLFGSGETGANHNHLLETQLALTMMGCVVAGRLVGGTGRWTLGKAPAQNPKSKIPNPQSLLAVGLILLQLWVLRERPPWYGGQFTPLEDNPSRYVAFIRSQPGEVLADDVGLLVAAGRPLRYDDPSTMGPAVSSGVWDESNLLAEVAARRFSAIMLPLEPDETIDAKGRWTPTFIATLREHYKPLYRDRITTYVPR